MFFELVSVICHLLLSVKLKEKHLCQKTGFLFAYRLAEVLLFIIDRQYKVGREFFFHGLTSK